MALNASLASAFSGRPKAITVAAAITVLLAVGACGTGAATPRIPTPVTLGRAYDRLPSDVRSRYDSRLAQVLAPRVAAGGSADDSNAVFQALLLRGYGRLTDSQLVEFLRLRSAALDSVDTASCAHYGNLNREEFLGSEASQRMDEALPADLYQRFADLLISAVEAEAAAEGPGKSLAPFGVGSVPEDVMSPLFMRILDGLDVSTARMAIPVLRGTDTSDEAVCSTWRAIYHGALNLEPDALATYARGDVVLPPAP